LDDGDAAGKQFRIGLGPEIQKQGDHRGRLVAHGAKENDACWLSNYSHEREVMIAGDDDSLVLHGASPEDPVG